MNHRQPHIVVVGGGLAGWTTATTAAEAGAAVTLLEKEPEPGGSTILSGGFVALAGTREQRDGGIVDNADLLEEDLLSVGQNLNRPDLVRSYAQGQPRLIDWMADHGLKILDVELSSGQSRARSHRIDPVEAIASLRAQALDSGVDRCCNAPATELVIDARRVVGVRSNSETIMADAVVLATGGFSRSEDLLTVHAPDQARALRVGGEGSTGDGLRLGIDAGAALRDMDHVKGTFGTHPEAGADRHELLLAYYLGAIIVNHDGQRFVDESQSYKLLGDACLAQPDATAHQVFDQLILDESPRGVPLFDPRPLIDRGLVLRADSWAELASRMGVPASVLLETVETYNAASASNARADPPRLGLVHGAGQPPQLTTPPFYAYPSTSVVLATYCGLAVDDHTRVLDGNDRPISGLYAVGEVTGGFHGAAYMTGSSLGKALHFGITAGNVAAAAPLADGATP